MEYYYKISALQIPRDIDPEEIEHGIDQYLNTADMIIKQLKTNFQNNNFSLFNRNMMLALKLLKNIRAEKLEAAGNLLVKALKNGQTDLCRKALPVFIDNLHTLSNKIHKAKGELLNKDLMD